MYWGSLMIGRWAGAITAFDLKHSTKNLMLVIVPFVAFGIIIGLNSLAMYDMRPLYWYVICVAIQVVAFFISDHKPARMLLIFSVLAVVAMMIGLLNTGNIAIYAILSGGLFCSIMWPSIFSLSLAGLGKYTTQGSAFLIMMILGGGIIPPIQGKLSDYLQSMRPESIGYGIHASFVIPVICFAYLVVFALIVKNILKKQGIDYDASISKTAH